MAKKMRLSVGYTLGCVLCLALVRQDVLGNIAGQTLYAGQDATDRTRHGTTDWLQIGKGVVKAVYCHLAYLTYMQSTS